MQAIEQKILSCIYGRGRGWVFTKTDFVADFGEANIHKALSALTKAGTIRRVCVGCMTTRARANCYQLTPKGTMLKGKWVQGRAGECL